MKKYFSSKRAALVRKLVLHNNESLPQYLTIDILKHLAMPYDLLSKIALEEIDFDWKDIVKYLSDEQKELLKLYSETIFINDMPKGWVMKKFSILSSC